jgi:xylan 1,4-beta-xylosidase
VQDPYGNYWHFATMVVGINFNFERRIGQFPAGFDEEGQLYSNTAYGDFPHYLPSQEQRGGEDWFTGWMLLSYEKPVEASSFQDDFKPENVVDENIKTFWVAKTNKETEWLTVDLEQESEVRAIQINYADYKSNLFGKPAGLYHQYLIEFSVDGQNWAILIDKREKKEDVPNDYVELASPQRARYIRFTNHHLPTPNLAISDLRIFGKGAGEKPAEVVNFRVERGEDRRKARLSWDRVEGGQGYHVYFGIHPGKLYNSVMVYKDTAYQLNALNVIPDYFFSIEAFNENGISERSAVLKAK